MNEAVIVTANFYQDIAEGLLESCRQGLSAEMPGVRLHAYTVPGALEIPPALHYFAEYHKPVCMVALGCVIRGETYHFEVVANTSASGIMQTQLQTGVPIGNGILTVENHAQAMTRLEKGGGAARAAVALARHMRRLA